VAANEGRRPIHVFLEAESHQGIHELADREGVSMTALVNALIGHTLDHRPKVADWRAVVKRARTIDAERRRRS
jgi:hypothetical protein